MNRGTEAAMKAMLNPDELRVESFETAEAEGPPLEQELIGRTPFCSAIDLCPTRPC